MCTSFAFVPNALVLPPPPHSKYRASPSCQADPANAPVMYFKMTAFSLSVTFGKCAGSATHFLSGVALFPETLPNPPPSAPPRVDTPFDLSIDTSAPKLASSTSRPFPCVETLADVSPPATPLVRSVPFAHATALLAMTNSSPAARFPEGVRELPEGNPEATDTTTPSSNNTPTTPRRVRAAGGKLTTARITTNDS